MRERWFGATGKRVPELAVEGDPLVPSLGRSCSTTSPTTSSCREAHAAGTPVVVRADSPEQIIAALKRPEVASVLVPENHPELLALDLRELTYG